MIFKSSNLANRRNLAAAVLLLAASFVVPSNVASAGETPSYYNWSGVYVGGNVGWSGFKSEWTDVDEDWGISPFDAGSRGFLLGGVIGYNHQLGNNLVLGIEGDLAFTSNKRSFDPTGEDEVDMLNRMDMFGTVRARAGYAFDRLMPYVTGGLAVAHFKHVWTERDDVSDSWPDFGGNKVGWTLGAGVELALSERWTVKTEYLHADFGDVVSMNEDGYRLKVDRAVNTVRFGLNYRF